LHIIQPYIQYYRQQQQITADKFPYIFVTLSVWRLAIFLVHDPNFSWLRLGPPEYVVHISPQALKHNIWLILLKSIITYI
jgi:hypothetical protein